MFRTLAVALFLCFAVATSARAQNDKICGGHLERYLKGYTVFSTELSHWLDNAGAIAACRAELNASNPEHRLIEAYILLHGVTPDHGASLRLFDAACAQGSELGCFYGGFGPNRHDETADVYWARTARALSTDLPVAHATAGWIFFSSNPLERGEGTVEMERLRRASDQGDWWATDQLAMVASFKGGKAGTQLELMRMAGDQGHVPSLLKLAEGRLWGDRDRAGAIDLFRRAALSDPRWFRSDIARAQYRLATMLREGERTEHDPVEAQRWLESAAALGNEDARKELQKK